MTTSRAKKWPALFAFFGATFLVAGIAGRLTAAEIPGWYAGLAKPAFNPPDWIFGPVWSLLYAGMAVAAWLVWCEPESRTRQLALVLFWLQLAANFAWSLIFFRLHAIRLAGVEILVLWAAIFATLLFFARVRRSAAWLLVPYLAWVSFATLLNWSIAHLNQHQ